MIPIVEKPISSEADIRKLEASGDWASISSANSIYELLASAESRYGQQFALTFLPNGSVDDIAQRYTYREFMDAVRRAANLFTSLGVGREDVVSILAPNLPEAFIALWGATTVGIANPINFLLNQEQVEALLLASNSKVLVAFGPNPKLDIWEKVKKLQHRLPNLKTVLQVGGDSDHGEHSFERCCQEQPEDRLLARSLPQRHDRALYFHTGGTTGTPKLAARCHENEMYCAWAASQMWHYTPGDVLINVLPFFHVAGTIVSGLGPLISGAELVLPSHFGLRHPTALANIWKIAEKYRATHLGGVPTNLVAMLALPRAGLDLSKLRYTLTGGAALPIQLGKSWREIIGKPLTQIYGMTEAGSTIAGSPVLADPVDGAVGIRFPYGSWRIAPVEQPNGLSLAPYRQGVVVVKSPGTFLGYLDEKQNQGVLLADGSVVTGDLGYSDEQGNLFLCGRSKDLIIRGGHNIDPSAIEEALCFHDQVALAAAVGRPDIYAGEIPVAYVQLKDGAQCSSDDLLAWVGERISEAPAQPKAIMIVTTMPMTAVGKIFKPALRYLELERVALLALTSIEGVRVLAREDALLGQLVEVFLPDDQNMGLVRENVAQCLGRYSFNFQISRAE